MFTPEQIAGLAKIVCNNLKERATDKVCRMPAAEWKVLHALRSGDEVEMDLVCLSPETCFVLALMNNADLFGTVPMSTPIELQSSINEVISDDQFKTAWTATVSELIRTIASTDDDV